ncbi:MAG TPA: glycosyltransferase [Patescibacteria group bacterium]|nr:glycosyltransferase [Patescibacteria group bacterium]
MKILLASEELTAQPEEGLLVFTMHLCRYLDSLGELTVLHALGDPEEHLRSLRILSPKVLMTDRLVRFLRKERFDVVLYIPSSGLTGFGLGRSLLLRYIARSPTILIALQERPVGALHRIVALMGHPELILSPVKGLSAHLARLGFDTGFIMPGYDRNLFRPVDPDVKRSLRVQYGLPLDRYIVLHVGHVRETRNMQAFLRYREWGENIQPVIKAGEQDPAWRDRLRRAGIIVIDEYIAGVHEIYQAADCYLFPVSCPTGALEFPLSVIEAAACNLPVLTTRFGALPDVIPEGNGILYFENVSDIPRYLLKIKELKVNTSKVVRELSWESVFGRYLAPHLEGMALMDGK